MGIVSFVPILKNFKKKKIVFNNYVKKTKYLRDGYRLIFEKGLLTDFEHKPFELCSLL